MTSRIISAEDRLDEARSSARARGIDAYRDRIAYLHLTGVTPNRGTLVAVLWTDGEALNALQQHPGDLIEIWPAAEVAELEDRERVWRRS